MLHVPYTVAWAAGLAGVVAIGLIRFLIAEARNERERQARAARVRAYARQAMSTDLFKTP